VSKKLLLMAIWIILVMCIGCIPELMTKDLDFNTDYVAVKESTITKVNFTKSLQYFPNPASWVEGGKVWFTSDGQYGIEEWRAFIQDHSGSLPQPVQYYSNGVKVSADRFASAVSSGDGSGAYFAVQLMDVPEFEKALDDWQSWQGSANFEEVPCLNTDGGDYTFPCVSVALGRDHTIWQYQRK